MDDSWISKIVDNKFNMSGNLKISEDEMKNIVNNVIKTDEYNLEEHSLLSKGFHSLSNRISDASFPYIVKVVKNCITGVYYVESMVTMEREDAIETNYSDSRLVLFNDKTKFLRETLDGTVILYGCKDVST